MRVEFTRENLKGLSPREGNGWDGCRNSENSVLLRLVEFFDFFLEYGVWHWIGKWRSGVP